MTPARPHARRSLLLLLVVGSGVLGGCAAHAAYVYDDPVYVSAAPVGIYAAPYVYYHGHPAYYADGRWYYRSPRGWATFRREPRELYTYRSSRGGAYRPWVYQAPRHDHRGYRAPARVYEAPRARVDRDRRHHEHRGVRDRRHDRDDREGRADRGRRGYDPRPTHRSHRESRKHVHVDRDRRSNHR